MAQGESPHFLDVRADLSAVRLQAMQAGSPIDPVAWHCLNAALCESIYPALQCAELALRNRVDLLLRGGFGPQWWRPGAIPLADNQRHRIAKAMRERMVSRQAPTPDAVVSALPLGFWTAFFNPFHAQTGLGALIAKDVFAHAPRTQRSLPALNRRWSAVRDLRNRVFHHERIIHRGDLQTTHADIVSLLSWMSPNLPMMLSWMDRFPEVLRSGIGPWGRLATTTRPSPR